MEDLPLGQYSRGRDFTADDGGVKRFDLTEEPNAEELSWTARCGAGKQDVKNQIRINAPAQDENPRDPASRRASTMQKMLEVLQETFGHETTEEFLEYASTRKRLTDRQGQIAARTSWSSKADDESMTKMLKMRQKPQSFSGKGQSVTAWINSMELYFRRSEVPSHMKMSIAESFLEGDVLNWYMGLLAVDSLIGWNEFSRKLRINYGGVSPLAAREKLRRVRMTGSLEDYIAEFNRVSLDCVGLPAAEEIEMFVDGLHPEIMKLMATQFPATKEEAIELAHTFNHTRERIERWRRAGNEERTGGHNRHSSFGRSVYGRGGTGRTGQGGAGYTTRGQEGWKNSNKRGEVKEARASPSTSQEHQRPPTSTRDKNEGQGQDQKKPLVCWNCGKEGHPRALCPASSN